MRKKTNKIYEMHKTKQFVRGFYFPEPNWENLPKEFPNLSKQGLTREERHLLDAIKLAYFVNQGGWKRSAEKNIKFGLLSLVILGGFIALILSFSSQNELTKSASAATSKIDEVIQSTMSAIIKNR